MRRPMKRLELFAFVTTAHPYNINLRQKPFRARTCKMEKKKNAPSESKHFLLRMSQDTIDTEA